MTKRIAAIATAFALGFGASVVGAVLWLANRSHESASADWPRPVAAARQATPIVHRDALADLESKDVLAGILLLPTEFQQTLALYALAADADREALQRLLDEADRLQPRREGYAAKSILYSRYAELDPDAAIERILAAESGRIRPVRRVIRAWAKYDHAAALQRAETLPAIYRRSAGAAVLSVSEDLPPAQRDDIAATFGLREHLDEMRTIEAIDAAPAEAWRRALAMPASSQRESTLFQIAHRWAEHDLQQAWLAVGELPPAVRGGMRKELMTRWAIADTAAARAWLQAQHEPSAGTTVGFAIGLAQSAPRQALDFSLGLANKDQRMDAVREVLDIWAERNPRAAAQALAGLGRSVRRRACELARNAGMVDGRSACRPRLDQDA